MLLFLGSKQLEKHIKRWHTTDNPYPCSLCEQRFSAAKARNEHVMKDHGGHKYRNEICIYIQKLFKLDKRNFHNSYYILKKLWIKHSHLKSTSYKKEISILSQIEKKLQALKFSLNSSSEKSTKKIFFSKKKFYS